MKVTIGSYPKWRWFDNFLFEKFKIKKEQKMSIHIDDYDTWSMDHTLAPIILPMLKQLMATKQGAPQVDLDDVPAELRPNAEEHSLYMTEGVTDEKFFERWDWIMGEMIWAFEQKADDDWESKYYKYEDIIADENSELFAERVGIKLVWEDPAGRAAHQKRMTNGFKLFGKYYENLWD